MASSTFCVRCPGIFQGHYVPTNILAQHDLVDTRDANYAIYGFDRETTEWKVRLDTIPGQGTLVPYIHHNLQDLAESADSCVFCAMIWERLMIDEFLTYCPNLAGMKKKDVVGIPIIQPKGTLYSGLFSFAILFVSWSGHNWKAQAFHRFNVFQAIS
jgi:hypothetical protein